MKLAKRICAFALCVLMLLSSVAFATDTESQTGKTPDYESEYPSYQYSIFKSVFELYRENHLYEFTDEELTEAFIMKLFYDNPYLFKMFINTLLGTMDDYSAYYETGTGIAASQTVTGYGISLGDENSYAAKSTGKIEPGVYITAVLHGSKALEAGIQTGDKVLSVEGIFTEGLSADAVLWLVKKLPFVEQELFDENGNSLGIPNEPEYIKDEETGKKTYPLHMTLERNGESYDVTLVKGDMTPSQITYDAPEDESYAYILISSFQGEQLVDDFRGALEKAKSDKRENLIIDLRDNAGGNLDYANAMADMFVGGEGNVMYYLNSRDREEPEAVYADSECVEFEKITILVNEYTASASELFAMVLRHYCGAKLVGRQTYGKAVGQYGYTFINGDIITVTAFELLTPEMTSYNGIGLVPDVETTDTLALYQFPTDLEIFNYINYKEMALGVESETVLGFERRMNMLGYLRSEKVDGVYDECTVNAIKAMQLRMGKSPKGALDDSDVVAITNEINSYKNYYYYYDSEIEVAIMSFRSVSQAKRRVEELKKASSAVEKHKKEYEDYLASLREADIEAEKAAEAEKANGENQ